MMNTRIRKISKTYVDEVIVDEIVYRVHTIYNTPEETKKLVIYRQGVMGEFYSVDEEESQWLLDNVYTIEHQVKFLT